MAVDEKHPLYREFIQDWRQMRDTHRGERIIKAARVTYLPPTSGMVADGLNTFSQEGTKAYLAYVARAVFPDIVKQGVEAMLGVMHHKPPVIELPERMQPLLEKATLKNESLAMLLRRINEEQLVTGRLGLLAEVPDGAGEQLPFVAFYRAEDVINWDEGQRTGIELENLNLVVLNESEFERTIGDFEWEFRQKYRVLVLGDVDTNEPQGSDAEYRVGVFKETSGASNVQEDKEGESSGLEFDESVLITPEIAGKAANEIPFVFINAKDIVPDPDDPPLLGVSNISLTIYRGEADYRQALFMQGQDTLVVVGQVTEGNDTPAHRVGSGASIDLPMGGDAKFIGTDSTGLSEMRTALENDHTRAGKKAGELMDETSRQKESGEALQVRVAAKTATLNQIALAGAFGLQELLRKVARWLGLNPEEVIVTPNLDFTDEQLTGTELGALMGAKMLGAPLSVESVHKLMEDRGMTDLNFEEELKKLEEEAEIEILQPDDPEGSTDEDGPEEDEDDSGGGDGGGDNE